MQPSLSVIYENLFIYAFTLNVRCCLFRNSLSVLKNNLKINSNLFFAFKINPGEKYPAGKTHRVESMCFYEVSSILILIKFPRDMEKPGKSYSAVSAILSGQNFSRGALGNFSCLAGGFEISSFFHHEPRRDQRAKHPALAVNFNPVPCLKVTFYLSVNN